MKYKMTITTGGGTEQDGGDFEIKETPKTLTFLCVREPFFSAYNQMIDKKKIGEGVYSRVPVRINKYYAKARVREDGNYEAWRDEDGYRAYFNNGHVARKWDDGTWTVYPNQCGIPHYLEPLTQIT